MNNSNDMTMYLSLLAGIEIEESNIEGAKNHIQIARDEVVEHFCPFKFGDLIEIADNGFLSYSGRMMQIDEITFHAEKDSYKCKGPYFEFIGFIMKNNGDAGLQEGVTYLSVEDC